MAPLHPQEDDRRASVLSYRVEDAVDDPSLQALVTAVSRVLDVPVAGIVVMGLEQHYLARVGVPVVNLPRELSLCTHTVHDARPVVVADTRADARFATHPLVVGEPQVRAYAGVPLLTRDGLPLGTLCAVDVRPRDFTAEDVALMQQLARAATGVLELLRHNAGAGLAGRDVLGEGLRLRRGIDDGELRVHYQPVLDLQRGRLAGVEALVRWQHPERGLLPPAAFVPVAEVSNLVVALGREVLGAACRQVARWRRAHPHASDLTVAVNVSGRQLVDPDFAATVEEALAGSGLPPSALTLELTETALVGGDRVQPVLQRLRARGVRLALDDFGTGYSSLAYLRDFPVDEVKIDRGFTTALGGGSPSDVITAAAVGLAHELGCDVVVEGVEDRLQLEHVRRLGARYAQGYLFSRPRSAEDFTRYLAEGPQPV
ncbi:EAL domain-containing protein [Kineosporiaceae bacterium B12]|nr:EAL domain-containing protein [Kineococcus rubinsiae]